MKRDIKDGERHGMLVYIGEAGRRILPSGQPNRMVRVRCDCGKETVIRALHFVRDRQISCGCILRPRHGKTRTHLYNTWRGMVNRCVSDKYIDHHRYKDRGISVCEEWRDFKNFNLWALANGYEDGLQLDRIDNNKGYYPQNCRFVTCVENVNNRDVTVRVNYRGKDEPLQLLLRDLGLIDSQRLIYGRIRNGWPIAKAIETPARKGNYKRSNQHGMR